VLASWHSSEDGLHALTVEPEMASFSGSFAKQVVRRELVVGVR
jgi:hypothetical protein